SKFSSPRRDARFGAHRNRHAAGRGCAHAGCTAALPGLSRWVRASHRHRDGESSWPPLDGEPRSHHRHRASGSFTAMKKSTRGFTLLEVLVATAIMGIAVSGVL